MRTAIDRSNQDQRVDSTQNHFEISINDARNLSADLDDERTGNTSFVLIIWMFKISGLLFLILLLLRKILKDKKDMGCKWVLKLTAV